MKQLLLLLLICFLNIVFVFPNSYFGFIPNLKTILKKSSNYNKIELNCFDQLDISFNNSEIKFDAKNKKSLFCYDTLLIMNHHRFILKNLFLPGKSSLFLDDINYQEDKDINYYGINIFHFNNGFLGSLYDIYKTSKLFKNSHTEMEKENLKFVKENMNHEYQEWGKSFIFNESEIKSGDFFSITRLDGLDPMIMWGTGSFSGHTGIALWIENELYICESTDENPFGDTYWPEPYGIIKTPYKKWVKLAEEAGYMVVILRLNDQNQKIFDGNLNKVISSFNTVEGLPYGKNNFLFGWIDKDNQNFPGNLSLAFLTNLAANLYKYPKLKKEIDIFLTQALNHRLDLVDKNKKQDYDFLKIIEETINLNYPIKDLFNIPESDDWTYSDGKSYVCNTFVTLLYKIGGIFGIHQPNIQATEFSPRDSYMIKIFKNNWYPSGCDNGNDLCQIMGKYKVILPKYNTIDVYSNMNQNCPSKPKDYYRPNYC